MNTSRILILYAHPDAERSRANRAMLEALHSAAQVHVHDLYQCYPDFHIDIAHEQTLLLQADLIILQHPIYWYSMPALQKEWLDLVLQRGWAFGPGGNALHGKDFWLVASTGAEAEAYQAEQRHAHSFDAFLPAYRQIASLCGMRWRAPYILHGAHHASNATLSRHAANYRVMLDAYLQDTHSTGTVAGHHDTR